MDDAWGKPPYRVVNDMRGMDGPRVYMLLDCEDKFLAEFGNREGAERRAHDVLRLLVDARDVLRLREHNERLI
jgi:hypothetical protein